jgi:hypothetical protein
MMAMTRKALRLPMDVVSDGTRILPFSRNGHTNPETWTGMMTR